MKTFLNRCALAGLLLAGPTVDSLHAADEPAPSTAARNPGERPGRGFARELDLSAEQRQALKDVLRTHQPVLRPLRAQARTDRETLRALVAEPLLNETALAAQADRIAANHRAIVVASARMRADLRKILTAEQLAKFDERRAEGRARREDVRERARERLMEP